ncbi:hypothetical protein GCM10017673_33180 [Streptosporangium violaceochromogenes]|nr:hypothetical protein GCM10017673_33180 [Streptosporangium violaceochromogenes]
MLSQAREVERTRDAKRPRKRPTTLCEFQTAQGWVQGSTTPLKPSSQVRDDDVLDHNQAEQLGGNRADPAAHTHSQWGGPATVFQLTVWAHLRNRPRPPLVYRDGCRYASR